MKEKEKSKTFRLKKFIVKIRYVKFCYKFKDFIRYQCMWDALYRPRIQKFPT